MFWVRCEKKIGFSDFRHRARIREDPRMAFLPMLFLVRSCFRRHKNRSKKKINIQIGRMMNMPIAIASSVCVPDSFCFFVIVVSFLPFGILGVNNFNSNGYFIKIAFAISNYKHSHFLCDLPTFFTQLFHISLSLFISYP